MSGAMGSKTMTYHVIGADGVLKRSDRFEAPYAAMVDFAVTRDYVLFPVFPLTFDLDRMGKLGSPFFDDGAGAYIGVLERDAPVVNPMDRSAGSFIFRYLNAWNEGKQVTFDAIDFAVYNFLIPKVICPAMLKRRAASRDGGSTSVLVS